MTQAPEIPWAELMVALNRCVQGEWLKADFDAWVAKRRLEVSTPVFLFGEVEEPGSKNFGRTK